MTLTRSFKLLKKYPGSAHIGYIVEFSRDGNIYLGWHEGSNGLKLEDCENNPEYWKEFIPTVYLYDIEQRLRNIEEKLDHLQINRRY